MTAVSLIERRGHLPGFIVRSSAPSIRWSATVVRSADVAIVDTLGGCGYGHPLPGVLGFDDLRELAVGPVVPSAVSPPLFAS